MLFKRKTGAEIAAHELKEIEMEKKLLRAAAGKAQAERLLTQYVEDMAHIYLLEDLAERKKKAGQDIKLVESEIQKRQQALLAKLEKEYGRAKSEIYSMLKTMIRISHNLIGEEESMEEMLKRIRKS